MLDVPGLSAAKPTWRFWRRQRAVTDVTTFANRGRTLDEIQLQDDVLFIPVSRALFEAEEGHESLPVTCRFERATDRLLVNLIVKRVD